jgi:pimeloyl-ACP methyl ester carboxylesterase
VSANGISIAYESSGACDAQVVLLTGGTGQQLVEWPMALVDKLVERGYRVLRFDNRDAGLSTHMDAAGYPNSDAITAALQHGTPPPIPYTLDDMAEDTVGLLDALSISRAHLVGASMRGDIAELVAINHPERVLSLTLVGADSENPELPLIAMCRHCQRTGIASLSRTICSKPIRFSAAPGTARPCGAASAGRTRGTACL